MDALSKTALKANTAFNGKGSRAKLKDGEESQNKQCGTPQHSGRAHALLGASKASQWIPCTPSARLQESIEDTPSAYASQGTSAHELGELDLRCQLGGFDQMDVEAIENFCSTDQYFDQEMRGAVHMYTDYVMERYHAALAVTPDAVIMLEEQLDFSEWVPEGFGTGDVVIIYDGVLEIIDLKYGKGIKVSAVDNAQMKLYGLGAWTSHDYLYGIHTVIMTIVQPRLDSISSDTIGIHELLTWANETVVPAAALAWKGEGEFKAGEHCRWCKVKGNCRARADENMALLSYEFKDPALLSLDEVGPILSIAEHLAKWAKDVQEYAFKQAAAGKQVPGWKLVSGRSDRTITDKPLALDTLKRYGLDEGNYQKPPTLMGIGDLEKNVGKKLLQELIGGLIVKPPGKPVLVVETDKREPLGSVDGDFSGEDFDE